MSVKRLAVVFPWVPAPPPRPPAPHGLDRLVAVGGPDTRARVLDAAQVRPGPSTAQKALTWATRALAAYGAFRLGRDLLR